VVTGFGAASIEDPPADGATPTRPARLVVGVSGSSSPQLAAMFLQCTREIAAIETHLVLSEGARRSIELEMGVNPSTLEQDADVVYDARDMGAAVSSGSFLTLGMVIVPCSMRTLSGVATGNSDNLVTRAADVTLKERRPLVLVTRETPLSLIHIRNMETVTLAGATVLPPVPAFYHRPESIADLLRQTCGKVLDQFGVRHDLFRRWTGAGADVPASPGT
jgi:polyprenyl P-hydroxybenzoate/phenylacrylic acid decarboxylase-like protein